jgi:flavin-dependent dehydrogenase
MLRAWPASASSTAIVDDFLRQVVRARGVGVHAGAALDRVKAGKDFDVCGVVTGTHSVHDCEGQD